ncbi:MAG: hypothetical protein QME96_01275 [Myxococcota bacterium]|nr:hypothetical protein [Myxococcota bacterium]
MKTIVASKPFAAAAAACSACLEKDPLRHHPGRLRVGRTRDALVLATATRTEKVRISFRIPCEAGEPWVAVLDADGAARLAKALKSIAAGSPRKNGNGGGVEIVRIETTLAVSAGGRRVTLHAGNPQDDESGPPDGDTRIVTGDGDFASRIRRAMPFCAPAEYRDVVKGPFVYFRDADDGSLAVPVVVATDGHRLFVDGDARDCADTDTVLRVPGESWPSAARALDAGFERVRLVRTVVPQSACDGDDEKKPADKHLDHLVFESADREVRILLEEPQTSLPHWSSFVPRDTEAAGLDVTCDKADLARAAKAAGSGSRLSSKSCMLKAQPERGMLRIRSADPDGSAVEQEVDAEVRGASDVWVHLNPKYVTDAIGAMGTQKVRIRQMHPPLAPVRFLEVAPGGVELRPRGIIVMPVRGNDPPEESRAENAGEAEIEQTAAS